MNGNNPLVRFVDVQKSYDGESLVIKSLNMDVARGEFLTLLGPSGSGKTTCLMMLAGFEPATHGEIYLEEQPINHIPPHKRGMGMVFQNYALFPHMTVAENLAFPLEVRKIPKPERVQRIKRALEMVRLAGFEGRRPGQLSGGQKQRIAVARALVFDPELVLMDEPLGALDKNLREQMQYEIKQIHASLGVTVVYVTHDQGEALTMSNRVAVFDAGVIQQLASPETLYERPENAFVANFIGENNVLSGTVRKTEAGQCWVEIDGGQGMVKAKRININGVGQRATLSLRPERVMVGPQSGRLPNNFDATVEELVYQGDHIRTRIRVCGYDDFIVKIPNSSSRARLQNGESIRIGWDVEDCRALDPLG